MCRWILGALVLILFCSCEKVNKYFGLKDDNLVEEVVEAIILKKTGVDMDLTPSSKESDES